MPLGQLARTPSFAALLLAYRQAKRAQANERTAVGLLDFAAFEIDLPKRIRALRRKLAKDAWFDKVSIGELSVAPRSPVRADDPTEDGVHRVGFESSAVSQLPVRFQLTPTPEFLTAEVLYLWEFGPALDALVGDCCLGYRLACDGDGEVLRNAHSIYEYWPRAFERYRDEPIESARAALASGSRVQIVSTDVRSFFDCIDPSFMLNDKFVETLEAASANSSLSFDSRRYRVATRSLLKAYQSYRDQFAAVGPTLNSSIAVPIGSLISRVIANAVLASVDSHVMSLPDVICYRRYVDDIVVVSELVDANAPAATTETALKRLFPHFRTVGGRFKFGVPKLGPRKRVKFELNERKTSVHDLHGPHAIEFLSAIQESFAVVTSERRALWGNVDRLEDDLSSIDLFPDATAGQGHVPRLRDSDRFTLRRYRATAFIASLERCAVLLDRQSSRPYVDSRIQRLLAVLDGEGPFDHYELILALLRVAVLLQHRTLVVRLHARLDEHAGVGMDAIPEYRWRGEVLNADPARRGLRRYLRLRRREVVAGVDDFAARSTTRGRGDARDFFRAGLRHLDRETDVSVFGRPRSLLPPKSREWRSLRADAERDLELEERLALIDAYIDLPGAGTAGEAWRQGDGFALFLSVRPPQYFDVSQKLLSDAISRSDASQMELGTQIEEMVNALRGTRYGVKRREEARVVVEAPGTLRVGAHHEKADVRVALANLPVGIPEYRAAVAGRPILTHQRLRLLDSAWRELRASLKRKSPGVSSLFVLPELSVPRLWWRPLLSQAARDDVSVVAGLEYERNGVTTVRNEAVGVFATGYRRAAVVHWTKRHSAAHEGEELTKAGLSLSGPAMVSPRLVVKSREGRLGVLICSEILEADALADMMGRVELLVVPAWNEDTGSFDYVANAAAGLLVHAFVCIANNAKGSDTRVVAPIKDPRYEREWCRVVHRGECRAIWAELPVADLRSFHDGHPIASGSKRRFRPLPPGWT